MDTTLKTKLEDICGNFYGGPMASLVADALDYYLATVRSPTEDYVYVIANDEWKVNGGATSAIVKFDLVNRMKNNSEFRGQVNTYIGEETDNVKKNNARHLKYALSCDKYVDSILKALKTNENKYE